MFREDNLDEVASFRAEGDTAWYFDPLTTSDWVFRSHDGGRPGVLNWDRSRDCTWSAPSGIEAYVTGGSSVTQIFEFVVRYEGDVRVLLRRWFASVIAREAAGQPQKGSGRPMESLLEQLSIYLKESLETGRDPAEVVRALFPDVDAPSEDAVWAVKGLLSEIGDGDYSGLQIPGYVGPDSYYSDSAPEQTTSTAEQFPVTGPSLS